MDRLKIFTKSFLTLFALMRLTEMTTRNPFSIILFLVLVYVYSKLSGDRIESRIASWDITLSTILSALFTLFTLLAKYNTILGSLTSKLFCIGIIIVSALGLFSIFFHLCIWLLQSCSELSFISKSYTSVLLPYITVVICIVCWIPYFLFEFPAVMTPDSVNQLCQALGVYELTNQHSVIHTVFIGLCYRIGYAIMGNAYFGIALYTVIQMLFMAFTAGYVIKTMQKANIIFPILVAAICFYALMPYNGAYVVTMWKDIYFAGFMTLLACALMRLVLRKSETRFTPSEFVTIIVPYIISAIMVCLLRGNGWYAFLLTIPFVLIIYRKNIKFVLPVHIFIILVVLFIKYPLMNIYDIKQPDFAESISIPVQQIARVIVNGEQLSEGEYEYINQIMDIEQVPNVYQPDVSDNIKNLIRSTGISYLENNKSEFFKVWLSLGIKYPKSYFDAYVDQTVGYWYPDVYSEIGLADGIYDNPLGLSWQPVISGKILVKLKEIVFKLPELIPLYGIMWSMGFVFWLILILGALCIRSGEGINTVILFPFIMLLITLCIATPVSNEFRYAYPIFYALPILLVAPFIRSRS